MSKEKHDITIDVEQLGSTEQHIVATGFEDFNDKLDVEKYGTTKRKLSSRHVSLMIIGQSIGTGLFVGLSSPLVTSGSLSLFLGFLFWACLMIWPLMMAVGEMCSYIPLKGSFLHFAARWVDPALGFACTMMYLYTCLMFICVEAVAFASMIGYWTDVNPGVFIAVSLVLFLFFNVVGVNWYGEIEFWSSILKVLLIVGLMMFALISMVGGNPHGKVYGFQHWKEGGLMKEYLVSGSTGKFLGWWNVLIYAAFACGGPDMLAMVAGEIENPRANIGMAAKRSYIRIYLFYFGGIFFMNTMCASNNPDLLAAKAGGASGAAASPWVIGVKAVGVHGLDSLVNAVVVSSAWSCGNGFCYAATRCAYSASLAGYLPRFFSKCLKNGVPIYCVVGSILVGMLSFLSVSRSSAEVFNWFINLATTGILCVYLCIWWCYFKFRSAMRAQGNPVESPDYSYYKVPKFIHPYMTYLAVFINGLVLFFNGFWIFFPKQFLIANLFTSYFAPVFFVVLFVVWKLVKKTHFRTDLEADLTTGKQEIDEEEEIFLQEQKNAEVIATTWPKRILNKVLDFCFK